MWIKKFREHLKKTFARFSSAASVILFLSFALFLIISKVRENSTPPVVLPALAVVPTPQSNRPLSAIAGRVDETCASLPRPEKFEFDSKTAPTETDRFASVGYHFRSSRAAAEIYPSFIVWFTQNGWTNNKPVYERLEFSKGNQTVWLAPYHMKKAGDFFMVVCTEWKIEPAP